MKPQIYFLLQLFLTIQSCVMTNETEGPQPTDTTTGILTESNSGYVAKSPDGMKVTTTVVPSPTEPILGMSEDSSGSGDYAVESGYGMSSSDHEAESEDGAKATGTVVPSPTEPIPQMPGLGSGDYSGEFENGTSSSDHEEGMKVIPTVVPSPSVPTGSGEYEDESENGTNANTTVVPQPTESTTGIPGDSSGWVGSLIFYSTIGLVSAVVIVAIASCIIVTIACCCCDCMKTPDRVPVIYKPYNSF